MTCDDVRERLLTGDPVDPGDDSRELALHLSGCAACGELAAAVSRADSHLRQHVEDFVNAPTSTLDAQWAAALDQLGPAPRRWGSRVQRAVIVLAAAAVLAVVALPILGPPPPGPESAGSERLLGVAAVPATLREARSRVETFEAIDTEHLDIAGLDSAAEAARMKDALARKARALTEAEAALLTAVGNGEPEWRGTALGELADLYASMAEALARFPRPSSLDADQRIVYDGAIAAKVQTQRNKALAAYAEARRFATDNGLDQLVAEVDLRAAATRQALEATDAARLRVVASMLPALRASFDQAEACLEPSDLQRHRGLLNLAGRAVDQGITADATGLEQKLGAAEDELQEAEQRCGR